LEHIREVLSRNLIHYRNKKGFNRSELARSAGVNPQSYQEWEKGDAWPGPDKLEILAQFHGISSSSFFIDDENQMSLKRAADLLASHFSKQ
jgi:repressor LexA